MDIENIYLNLMGRSPEFAERWRDELDDAIASLQFMPRKCPFAPENDHYPFEMRHMRFNKYRLLFTIKDMDGDGQEDTVWIVRVRHAAQQWLHLEEKPE